MERTRRDGLEARAEEGVATLNARDGAVALALALVLLVTGSIRLVPGVSGVFHDDAVYAITAKGLAEGSGYRLINLPGAPPQTKYPILYPAVLAAVWKAGATLEGRLIGMQIVTLVAAALAIAMAYLYVVRFRYAERAPALAAGLLCASAPNVLYYSTQVLSEMPFALLLVTAWWAVDAYARAARRGGLLVGIAAGLPFLCRTAGVVVPPVAILVIARARRPLRGVLAGVALVTLPWILWMVRGAGSMAADRVLGYQQDYLGHWSMAYFGETPRSLPVLALVIFVANLGKAFAAFTEIGFDGFARAVYARVDWAHGLMIAIGALPWVGIAVRARRLELLPLSLLAYLLLACSWPWPPDRFMVPVLFLLAAMLFTMAQRCIEWLSSRRLGFAALGLVLGAGVGLNVFALRGYASASARSHYPYFMMPETPVAWSSYQDAFSWLRAHTAPGDVLAAGFDSMTALYTGHPTIRPFAPRPSSLYYGGTAPPLGTPSELARTLEAHRPRYLFLSPQPAFPEDDAFYALVAAFRHERPTQLRPVYQGSDPRFVIFEVSAP